MPGAVIQTALQRLAELLHLDAAIMLRTGLSVLVIWLLAWLANALVKLVAKRIVATVDDHDERHISAREKRGQTIAQLLRSVGRVVIIVIASLLTLNLFLNIAPLLAGAGILGLAISFGAQSLVKDVISGFFILMENQFAVGDVIEAAGKSGTVERMTLRVVMLRDLHGVVHVVPNGQIGVVSNLTRGWARAVVEIGVAFGSDVDQALDLFREEATALAEDPNWKMRLDGEPEVSGVESMSSTSLVIRTLFRTLPGEQWAVAREFRRRIKIRLDREGLKIRQPAKDTP